jgi:hypothetical protein
MKQRDFKIIAGKSAPETFKVMRYRSIKPLIVDAVQVNGPADVPTGEGILRAKAGDWLVRDPQGNVKICDNLYFTTNFASLKRSAPLEQFREQGCGGGC